MIRMLSVFPIRSVNTCYFCSLVVILVGKVEGIRILQRLWLWSMRSNTKLILMELATLIWQRHISKMSLTFTLTFFYEVRCTVISIKGDLISESIFIIVPLSKYMYKITAHQVFHQIKKFDRVSFWSVNENENIFRDLATFIVDLTCQYAVCITHGFSNILVVLKQSFKIPFFKETLEFKQCKDIFM